MKSIRYPIENVSIFESIFCAFVQAVEYMGRRHGNRLLAGFFQSKKSVCVRYSWLSPWKEERIDYDFIFRQSTTSSGWHTTHYSLMRLSFTQRRKAFCSFHIRGCSFK